MLTIQFLLDFLAALAAARITDKELVHEHDSMPVDGDIEQLATVLVGQGFTCHTLQRGKNAFLSRKGDSQIEPTSPDVPKHQAWRVKTEVGFTMLRAGFMFDPNFKQLKEYDVVPSDTNRMMAIMFEHVESEERVQFVWREKELFPPRE